MEGDLKLKIKLIEESKPFVPKKREIYNSPAHRYGIFFVLNETDELKEHLENLKKSGCAWYLDEDALEDFDLFDSPEGWRIDNRAVEYLRKNNIELEIDAIGEMEDVMEKMMKIKEKKEEERKEYKEERDKKYRAWKDQEVKGLICTTEFYDFKKGDCIYKMPSNLRWGSVEIAWYKAYDKHGNEFKIEELGNSAIAYASIDQVSEWDQEYLNKLGGFTPEFAKDILLVNINDSKYPCIGDKFYNRMFDRFGKKAVLDEMKEGTFIFIKDINFGELDYEKIKKLGGKAYLAIQVEYCSEINKYFQEHKSIPNKTDRLDTIEYVLYIPELNKHAVMTYNDEYYWVNEDRSIGEIIK